MSSVDTDNLKKTQSLQVDGRKYHYFPLGEAIRQHPCIEHLPVSLKILLENVLRFEHDPKARATSIAAFAQWAKERKSTHEIPFRPARILMQDFTGVPAVVDLAAMREGMISLKGDPQRVNPTIPVNLVIDHSVMVDVAGEPDALQKNVALEFERNAERYAFLRWGQEAFENFSVVPPGTGICHQVNLEYIAQVVWSAPSAGAMLAYPDTLYGTDSHTTMVNGIGVLGWGVGGIEAEAAMLGQPTGMVIPDVIGFRLTGRLPEGATATDLVLTVTRMLRARGVVNKFVEFYGPALDHLPVADRATISNMAPEYGATCGFFPVDEKTLEFLHQTGRDEHRINLVRDYLKAQGMFAARGHEPLFTDTLSLDLAEVRPSIAGPKRPQDQVLLSNAAESFRRELTTSLGVPAEQAARRLPLKGAGHDLGHGDVVIAAITSCTNTSNPAVMIGAGLVARKARALGLKPKPWVKTSLAPGSQIVTGYLDKSGLSADLDALGFETVGYGCTTCIGNSGPLRDDIAAAIEQGSLVAVSVLSGNRNFEGRISPHVRANYLASPPLVVAYALLGTMCSDITTTALGTTPDGREVYLKDIWPTSREIEEVMATALSRDIFIRKYAEITRGTKEWQALEVATGSQTYGWDDRSTYVRNPPYFEAISRQPAPRGAIEQARILALLGDNITTDHISPAGAIKPSSPAGRYLAEHGVHPKDFNSYGSRRGNHEVMVRGTFANIRIRNEMVPGVEGGMTRHFPSGEVMPIYDAAMKYQHEGRALVVFGGKEYGMGSSRDWAAKGVRLLGVSAVIVESFERIHRANLVGMGVLPLVLPEGVSHKTLALSGEEMISISGLESLAPRKTVQMTITRADGRTEQVPLLCRIDTVDEVHYYRHGGILPYVLRDMACPAGPGL